MIRSALMTVMTNAAIKAGRGLKRDYGEVEQLQVSLKGPGDFVSLADKRSEKTIFEELSKARPGYGFVMEEAGRVEGSDKSHTWHIDPLDATTNFLHAIPIFAISIALEREGQIVAGVVYNPATDETYVAEKGQGAFGGARRMRVAARRELSDALIGCGIPHLGKAAEHPRFRADLAAVMARVVNVRRLGCASLDLCYVANGRFDAFWERGLHSWDIAAGELIVREAGGFVTDCDGGADYLKIGRYLAAATSSSTARCWGCCAPRRRGARDNSGLDARPGRDASMSEPEIRSLASMFPDPIVRRRRGGWRGGGSAKAARR